MSKSLTTTFNKKVGDCESRKRKQCNIGAKTSLSKKRKQLELDNTCYDTHMTLRSNSQCSVPVSISVCGYGCDDSESACDNGGSFEEFSVEMKRECDYDSLYDLQVSVDQDSSSHSLNKKLKQDANKQRQMELRSGRQVRDNQSTFMPPDQNIAIRGCSSDGEESRNECYHSYYEDILTEAKQEVSSDLDIGLSFIASDQYSSLGNSPTVIGEIVPRSWFDSEQDAGGYTFDSGLTVVNSKQMAIQKQCKMELRSGRLISCGQQSDDAVDNSQHPHLKNIASKSDFCELVMLDRQNGAADGEYETSMPVSASDWKSADNGFETLHDRLSGVNLECGTTHDEDLNYRIDNEETAVLQESDSVYAACISAVDPSLESLLSGTETTFLGVSDVHSADEPLSISSQFSHNQSQVACDSSARTVDIESLSLSVNPSASHNISGNECALLEPFAASSVCNQSCTSDNDVEDLSLLPSYVVSPSGTSPLEEIACDGDRDAERPSSGHDLTEVLQTSDDDAQVFLPSRDENCSDMNFVNSTSDVCLSLKSTPIQTGGDLDAADVRACSDLCGSNVFKEKESQANENTAVEHYVEPSSLIGNDVVPDSQSEEYCHMYSREQSTLDDMMDVEPMFETTDLHTSHSQSTGNDSEYSEVFLSTVVVIMLLLI